MKTKYTKKQLELIEGFLEAYDLGVYYKGEIYAIPRKTLTDLKRDETDY